MITTLSEMSCVKDSRPGGGEIARPRFKSRHIALELIAKPEAMPHDDLARLALAPEAAAVFTPRDDLAHLGLCCCGEPGQRGDDWM
jgi:hypothetical protein